MRRNKFVCKANCRMHFTVALHEKERKTKSILQVTATSLGVVVLDIVNVADHQNSQIFLGHGVHWGLLTLSGDLNLVSRSQQCQMFQAERSVLILCKFLYNLLFSSFFKIVYNCEMHGLDTTVFIKKFFYWLCCISFF